ncbi:hypothetical protein BaRGS_00040301 [Batillaria attramentaria]|uniref:Uncharacterized protein n=1 Tax=Batillaria attramentaria TaxID=370345 RepID=A0ABD0J0L4_9CAEN
MHRHGLTSGKEDAHHDAIGDEGGSETQQEHAVDAVDMVQKRHRSNNGCAHERCTHQCDDCDAGREADEPRRPVGRRQHAHQFHRLLCNEKSGIV